MMLALLRCYTSIFDDFILLVSLNYLTSLMIFSAEMGKDFFISFVQIWEATQRLTGAISYLDKCI